MGTPKPTLTLDGARVHDLASFWDEVSRVLVPGATWGRNLDAFHDILSGGFGTPAHGFTLVIQDHAHAAAALGHAETARWLAAKPHPPAARLAQARANQGPTLWDDVLGILKEHPEIHLILR